jgi:hypothetical protein
MLFAGPAGVHSKGKLLGEKLRRPDHEPAVLVTDNTYIQQLDRVTHNSQPGEKASGILI